MKIGDVFSNRKNIYTAELITHIYKLFKFFDEYLTLALST